MGGRTKKILLIVLAAVLTGELIFLGTRLLHRADEQDASAEASTEPTEATDTVPPATAAPESTASVTEIPETTVPETEPEDDNTYILTFTGDCTLGNTAANWNNQYGFVQTIGDNYDWPFANVLEYFTSDDCTFINLEGPLTDEGRAAVKTFVFRGPSAYTQILTGSSIEAVTLANNHTLDYGQVGYNNTTAALTAAGVGYVEADKTAIYTTESGLTIGLYGASMSFSESKIRAAISQLRSNGAEIVICAFHWGTEGSYRANATQEYYGRLAIEAGADIVWGSHPHVLQRVERYENGIIYYSLGNFSFGGSIHPKDYDSALLQQEIIRNEDGTVSLGELTIIPVSLSSISEYNNYQPTPLEPGSTAYERVISKLEGTFTGPDLPISTQPDEEEEETTAPTETSAPTEAPSETSAPTAAPTVAPTAAPTAAP